MCELIASWEGPFEQKERKSWKILLVTVKTTMMNGQTEPGRRPSLLKSQQSNSHTLAGLAIERVGE